MAKILFTNAEFISMDSRQEPIENVLTEDGYITRINAPEDIWKTDSSVIVEDLGGTVCLPGFHDTHMHMVEYGYNQEHCVDLADAASAEEVIARMRFFIQEKRIPPGSWVVGSRWNQEAFENPVLLSREDLDQVSDQHYVFAKRVCIHIAAVNSRVLELCGIEKNTFTDDVNIGRYENGEPDGRIYEDAIAGIVLAKKPSLSVDEFESILEKTLYTLRRHGITTVQTDDMKAFPDFESKIKILQAYQNLRRSGRLPIRVIEQIQISSPEEFFRLKPVLEGLEQDHMFSVGSLKLILDGSLGAGTAAMCRAYKTAENQFGLLNYDDAALEKLIHIAVEEKMQIMCHCIGDRAMLQAIRLLEKLEEEDFRCCRPRLVHCQIAADDILARMAESGFLADIQPLFVLTDYPLIEKMIHVEKHHRLYAWKSMAEAGILLCGSSDTPVDSFDVLAGIQAAVTRKGGENCPDGGWDPQEKLDVQQALALYTVNPAFAAGREKELGKIQIGYRADFVILDRNPMKLPPEQIQEIRIRNTYCGGKGNGVK